MRRSRHDQGHWIAPCRDIAGRRRAVVVIPIRDGRIALIAPAGEVAVLDLLGAGRLRGALRDAGLAVDDPRTASQHWYEIPLAVVGA